MNVTTDPKRRVDITDTSVGKEIVFSYSVEWLHQPHIKYEQRMERYHDSAFLPSTFEIHWLSIINAFVLVILLTTFLAIILMRILKKDFSRYMEVDDVTDLYSDSRFTVTIGRIAGGRNWMETH